MIVAILLWIAAWGVEPAEAQDERPSPIDLLADLASRGLDGWTEHRLARRPSRYRIRVEDGRALLQVESVGGNSGLVRRISLPSSILSEVAWRWRVAGSLTENQHEAEQRGDDFAARVFVIFDGSEDPWSGRAICYVWSGNLPVGTAYLNPYTDRVAMVVVESGDGRAGRWVGVRRDVIADYRRAFGDLPDSLTAVALMVDTDDTQGRATAWFERLDIIRASSRE